MSVCRNDTDMCDPTAAKRPERHYVGGHEATLAHYLDIEVLDEKGAGGAHHHYRISTREDRDDQYVCEIKFQKGPILENNVNGVTVESLLAICRHRLECFQAGDFGCQENADALAAIITALNRLHDRTRDRMDRQVEGLGVK